MIKFYKEIEEEFFLFGISTTIEDETKFAYLLNRKFGWKLQRIEDLDVFFDGEEYCFSTFLYEDPHNDEDYFYLIKNESHEKVEDKVENSLFSEIDTYKFKYLLNKYKQYQFLIKLSQDTDPLQINHLTLEPVDFFIEIQQIDDISKIEKKYFLI